MKTDIARVREWIKSPIVFIGDVWGLVPQPLREGYVVGVNTNLEDIKVDWFLEFERGKHITWQQWVILLGVERGLRGGRVRISVASGHGIGKSTVMAWLLLWFLICYENSNIPCTAPTAKQMFDVLWKEVSKWHRKLPEALRELLVVESSYVRVKERPREWYARAATARKENPEALAGVHSDNVLMLVDESSAVCDEIFETGLGATTGQNVLMVLISNHTRLSGYFHKTQENEFKDWLTLKFSSVDSPIVEEGFVEELLRNGEESNEYRVRVLGLPPNIEEEIDGYVPLIRKSDLRFSMAGDFVQPIIMGVDPSGEGRNKSAIVIRDMFRAKCMGKWRNLKSVELADKVVQLAEYYKILPDNILVDGFGVGMEVLDVFMKMRRYACGVLVSGVADEKDMFMNRKAEMYWRMREWLINGGELMGNYDEWKELMDVRYTQEGGKVKIMSKKMLRLKEIGLKSPDMVEALMLTFYRKEYEGLVDGEKEEKETFDPFEPI
jgi:phage terminase large subunit